MRYKETIKRGISLLLLLVLVLAVSLIVPAAAVDGGRGAEMVAAFDKTSYSAGETVTVTFMVYGADFDAAGFHVTYDQSSLKYQSVQAGSSFTMPVCKAQESALELMVESDSVQQPASSGTVIAKVTFNAVTGGAKTLTFTSGSAAYLERKNAVVYNGYQALNVTAGVAVDAAADAALRQAKADAVAQLETDINGKLEAGVTVAQRELLLRCLQSGRAVIHNAATQEAVKEALDKALAQAAEIAAETTLEFPKLTALYDAENNDSTTIGNMYPTFSPDATAYFLCNSRPINGIPRSFKGATTSGVTVVFNGDEVSVAVDGTFAFAVPFQAMENCNTLVLTDENTGLSTTYAFYSFGYGVSGGFSNVKVYDEEGNAPGDKIQEASLSGSITRFSSNIDKVRIGFDGSAAANEERLVELVDGNGRVLQSFISASGNKPVSQTFLSDVIQLKEGLNCLLLRYQGVDKSKWEDGKPVETPAYKTKALVINYVDPNNDDPALIDTVPEKMELFVKGVQDSAPATALQELTFQWKEKTETTPARYESTVELSPDDFDLNYPNQMMHLRIALKEGQEVTVTGGNDMAQPRTLMKDGTYPIANYYESFGSANKPTVMKKDAFTVTITVTAKDGIHKDTYFITVNKSGRAALVVPKIYQSRELLIVANRPIRNVLLPFDAVSITDAEGLPVNTARALKDGTLKIQITDPAVVSWDGEARNSGSIAVDLLKQGKTDIKLVYDDGALHLDGTTVLYVNYKINVLADARSDAADLWTDAKNGKREYEDGAVDALKDAIQAANTVYDKYKDMNRRLMNQTQFDEINDAVNDLREAIKTFQYKEIGVRIVEFPGWPEDYDLPEEVDHETRPKDFVPKQIDVITAAGERLTLDVTWKCSPNYSNHDGQISDLKYTLTLVLPTGYIPAAGVDFPTFIVNRMGKPFDNLLTPDNVWLPEAVDGGRARKAVKTVETPAILRVYRGTELEEILALTLETGAGVQQAALPTKWLIIPENYDPDNVGGSYLFTLTAVAEQKFENRIWHWRKDFTEDKREFQIRVYIIDPPVVEVTGLPDNIDKIKVTGKKTDSVLGQTVKSDIEEFEITAADGWKKELVGAEWRGQRLCKLEYEFVAEDIEGYAWEPRPAEDGNYVIAYTRDKVDSLTLETTQLVLTKGGTGKLIVKDGDDDAVYSDITWEGGSNIIADVKQTQKNNYIVTAGQTVGKTEIRARYEGVTSNSCTIIVLPETLTDVSPIQAGSETQLTFPYSDDVKERTTWSSTDESIATVDKNGVVTAIKEGETTITATVQTDNLNSPRTATVTCTITVTPADPGGGGGGGTGNGSGNGGGTLSGQATSGGGGYRDLLTDPLPQQGSNGTNKPNANTAQGARRPQAGTSQTTGQKSEATTDAAGNGGDGAGSGTTGRVISVSKGDKSPGSAKELAVILISCSVLLAAGIFHGKKRGEN